MTPTANSSPRANPSGTAEPRKTTAPPNNSKVSVWPSPQVTPCLTIRPTDRSPAAMLATAAM